MRRIVRVAVFAAMALALAVGSATSAQASGKTRIDINRASEAELTALPGIGPAKAAAIVEERQRAPFRSVADLTRVSGIGERSLDELRDRITVDDSGDGRAEARK